MGFLVFIIIVCIFISGGINEWTKNSKLTAQNKDWAIQNNHMTYIDYHNNVFRDTRTNIISKEFLGQDKNGRYFNYLIDEKGNIIRARYVDDPNDPVDLIDRKM